MKRLISIMMMAAGIVFGQGRPVFYDGSDLYSEGGGATNLLSLPFLTQTETADLIETYAEFTLFGATNAHPTVAGAYSLLEDVPATETIITNTLAVGTNFVGTFLYTNTVNFIRDGTYRGKFYASKTAATTVKSYMELIEVDGATTNILGTSAQVPFGFQTLQTYFESLQVTNDITCTNCYIGINFYLIREGNPNVDVLLYLGGQYNTHLETPGLDLPSTVLTNSAGARVTVANTNAATASTSDTEVYTAKATEQAARRVGKNPDGNIVLGTNWLSGDGGNEGVYVDASGKVGIGTTNPVTPVQVYASVGSSVVPMIQLKDPSVADGGGGAIDFRTTLNDIADRYVARIAGVRQAAGALSQLRFYTETGSALTEKMRIMANGDVGIGTDTPTNKLHVVGDIYATGKMISGGGYDPPYMHLYEKTLQAVQDRVAYEVPPSMYKGAVNAYIEDLDSLYWWQPSSGKWLRLSMVNGTFTKGITTAWTNNMAPHEWSTDYQLDAATGEVKMWQWPVAKKQWFMREGYSMDNATGLFYDAETNQVTKAQAIEYVEKQAVTDEPEME